MNIKLVIVGIKSSGNLGAIARLSHNFAISQLILVSPECEINDEAYERAIRGRSFLDNILIVDHFQQAKAVCDLLVAFSARVGGYYSINRAAVPLSQINEEFMNYDGNLGLVFGRENTGLTNNELDECDYTVTIPLASGDNVLNISHAISVTLWELTKNQTRVEIRHRLMDANRKSVFFEFLATTLPHLWIEEENTKGITKVFHSVFGRALLTEREGNTLLGYFRALNKSLDGPHPDWDDCGKGKKS